MGDGYYFRIRCQLIEGLNEANDFIHFLVPGILCVNKPTCFVLVLKMLLSQFSIRPLKNLKTFTDTESGKGQQTIVINYRRKIKAIHQVLRRVFPKTQVRSKVSTVRVLKTGIPVIYDCI